MIHHCQMKHVEIDLGFDMEKISSRHVLVNFISSTEQFDDILTKPLTKKSLLPLRQMFSRQEVDILYKSMIEGV